MRFSTLVFVIPGLVWSAHAAAEPEYCAHLPNEINEATQEANDARALYQQKLDDERAANHESKAKIKAKNMASKPASNSPSNPSRDTASDEIDNVSVADFGNHDLEHSHEDVRRAQEKLISVIVETEDSRSPQKKLSHWLACPNVASALPAHDLQQPWASKEIHRFQTRWEQERSGVKMDESASIQTRTRGRHGATRVQMLDSSVAVAQADAATGDDDSPKIATHKMSADNLTRYQMVTHVEPRSRFPKPSAKPIKVAAASHRNAQASLLKHKKPTRVALHKPSKKGKLAKSARKPIKATSKTTKVAHHKAHSKLKTKSARRPSAVGASATMTVADQNR